MIEEKPSIRTLTAASLIMAYDKYGEKFKLTIPNILERSLKASRTRILVFSALALWGGYKAYQNSFTEQPPAYGPAAAWALLAAGSARGVKSSIRSRMVVSYYLNMAKTNGAAETEQAMREFAAPSLRILKAGNNPDLK